MTGVPRTYYHLSACTVDDKMVMIVMMVIEMMMIVMIKISRSGHEKGDDRDADSDGWD